MLNVVDIIQSIQVPQLIKDIYINKGTPILDSRGRPVHYTGGFAVVFPFLVNGNKWAFRCWSANIGDVEKRLHILSTELKRLQLSYFCDFAYEATGIIVNGISYPTTRMQWVDGKTIKDYLCEHKTQSEIIKKLAHDFLKMCNILHQNKIAHGDLQHGNILVSSDGNIYLIDYDSVYLPALQGENDIITGLPDYQHPARKVNKFVSEKLDYFSELIIYLSIRAIAEAPSLIDKYKVEDADRMLFAKEDYEDIRHSEIYKDISALGEEFKELLGILEGYLKENDINNLQPFTDFLVANKVLFTTSTEKAIRNRQTVVLNWLVPFEAIVTLIDTNTNLSQICPLKGNHSAKLDCDTEFVLSVEAKTGQVIKKSICIRVFDECAVEFKADKYYIYPTIPVTLSWNVTNAKNVWLNSESVEDSGTKVIEPEKATTYILSAEDEFSIKEKRIDIQMLPIPQVKTLLVPTPNLTSNLSIHITQPKYSVGVRFPTINIGWTKMEIPKVPSLTDLGVKVELSPPLPEFNLKRTIKNMFNRIKKK